MKKLLSVFAILFAVGLIASQAFAAAIITEGAPSVEWSAAELVSPSTGSALPAVLTYTPSPAGIATPDVIYFTLTNGMWSNPVLLLCDGTATSPVAGGFPTPTPPSATAKLTLNAPLVFGTIYYLQDGPFCGPATTPLGGLSTVPGLLGGPSVALFGDIVTLSATAQTDKTDGNTAAPFTVTHLVNQFYAVLNPAVSVIDFVSAGNGNRTNTEFVPQPGTTPAGPMVPPLTNADDSRAALALYSLEFLFPKVTVTYTGPLSAVGCGGEISGKLMIKVTGNLDGLSALWYNSPATMTPINLATISAGAVTLGPVDLSLCGVGWVAGDLLPVQGATGAPGAPGQRPLVLVDDMTNVVVGEPQGTHIRPGVRNVEVTLVGGGPADYVRDLLPADPPGWFFERHSAEAFIPYLNTASNVVTTCVVSNWNWLDNTTPPTGAAVTFDVLAAEPITSNSPPVIDLPTGAPGDVPNTIAAYLGSILPFETVLITFSGDTVTLEQQSGIPLVTPPVSIVVPGPTVNQNAANGARYMVRLNIDAPVFNVKGECLQTDPFTGANGPKRADQIVFF